MSNLKVNSINDASGGSNAVLYGVAAPTNSMGFRNRIINGAMVIDQRNAGAAVTLTGSRPYIVDRWWGLEDSGGSMTAQQSSTAPAGFPNSLLFTTTSASGSLSATQGVFAGQSIEGFNVADLGWGAAGAQSVTLSFWVRSSLTGTFGGALTNSAENRSYPFTYTVSAANTYEQKTVTIAGDTSGTWLTTSGVGIKLIFGLGVGSTYSGTAGAWAGAAYYSATGATSVVGTNGATFYITGVQLEAGSVASPFERRDYGRELMMCQRYYAHVYVAGDWATNQFNAFGLTFPTTMRASPTFAVVDAGIESGLSVINFNVGSFSNTLSGTTVQGVATTGTPVRAYFFKVYSISAEL